MVKCYDAPVLIPSPTKIILLLQDSEPETEHWFLMTSPTNLTRWTKLVRWVNWSEG